MSVPLILLALACTGGSTTDAPAPGPCDVPSLGEGAAAEFGVGEDFFEPIDDGDEILVVFGPQGGYHLDASVRVQGIDPGDPRDVSDPRNPVVTFTARDSDGMLVSGIDKPDDDGAKRIQQGLDATCQEGVFEIGGRRIFLLATDRELEGDTLTVSVTVEDADGVIVSDMVDVVATPSPFNN